jgi:hypothetical protein
MVLPTARSIPPLDGASKGVDACCQREADDAKNNQESPMWHECGTETASEQPNQQHDESDDRERSCEFRAQQSSHDCHPGVRNTALADYGENPALAREHGVRRYLRCLPRGRVENVHQWPHFNVR